MPVAKYPHQEIEQKWQQRWQDAGIFSAPGPDAERKRYVLDMFPYPSGDGLHVGHPEGYTATDIVSRFLRMNGTSVLHPMGWDAFGLPAENAAIKKGIHPRLVTAQNIANFKRQIQSLGFSYDWSREVNTTDPAYYRWTQWIFLQLIKRGLAYEKEAPIWWCPKDKTGLANEEVVNGRCDRCGTAVERKMLKQWMLKITAYADRLLSGLDKLDWPESIKALQRNWIGRSEGADVQFVIPASAQPARGKQKVLIGTRNTAKIEMVKAAFRHVPELELVSLNDISEVDDTGLVEGDDDLANAKRKAEFYFQRTGIPTISTDHFMWIEKWPHNDGIIQHIRKIVNPQSSRATDEETIAWYKNFLGSVGGFSKLRFDFAIAYSDEHGTELYRAKGVESLLQLEQAPHFPAGYPTEALLKDPRTGEFRVEQADDRHHSTVAQCLREQVLPRILGMHQVTVYTTRPDTLFGATYLVLSPEHDLVDTITTKEHSSAVAKYKKDVARKSDLERTSLEKEKTGVFTGAYAINPVNNEKIPVWIADYVLSGYGTGAIMAVPAHDERDFVFATQFKLPIRKVIKPPSVMPRQMAASTGVLGVMHDDLESDCWVGEGTLINSGDFDGRASATARREIVAMLEGTGRAQPAVKYKLRDWVFSRQRYWGEPIPLVHCQHCVDVVESTRHHRELSSAREWQSWCDGEQTMTDAALAKAISADTTQANHYVKVTFGPNVGYWRVKSVRQDTLTLKHVLPGIILDKEKQLPILLPDVQKYEPTGTGESPLAAIDDWVNVTCRVCGHPAKRETNTMPQWAGSCWYYLRYCDPQNDQEFASAEALRTWLPVDLYVGGAEHAVLHLLYSRFWHMVLFDIGVIPPTNDQGESLAEPFKKLKNQGLILGPDGEKMSKSRGNVINPDEIIEKYGADTLRMYEMFMGPFEDTKPWDTNGMVGVRRFLERVWAWPAKVDRDTAGRTSASHRLVSNITTGITTFQFNTCISDLMKWSNGWKNAASVPLGDFEVFLKLLTPFAPHLAEELWQQLGHQSFLSQEAWPTFDPALTMQDTATIAVQVMGKLRGTITMPTGSEQSTVEAAAKAEPNVARYITGTPRKIIFVKDKLINFVV